jgi:phage shock protein A
MTVCAEQLEQDMEGTQTTIAEATASVAKLCKELAKLNEQLVTSEVRAPLSQKLVI